MTTKQEVLLDATEKGVNFILLQFTDIFGVMKNVSITASQLEKALDNKIMFDGSSIDGFVRIEESDMYLYPDPNSWQVYPWDTGENRTARLICDVYSSNGQPFVGDPRHVLRQVLAKAADMGFSVNIGPEAEFFLFHTDENGAPTLDTHDRASYFDLAPVDLGEAARREMVLDLEKLGFEVEAAHHECAPGQHEIDFKYADALTTADNMQTLKFVVRMVAQRHGLHATFMPKPIHGVAGSGMHVNQSLFKDGKNAFFDPNGPRELSETAYHYLAGLLRYAKEFCAVTNPTINSYKRLVAGYEAPVYIAWASRNRSPLVRIPGSRGNSTRMEVRCPDPSCNPYLAFAVMINAGLEGVRQQMAAPEPVELNMFSMTEAEQAEHHLDLLPDSMSSAIREMLNGEMVRSVLGEHIVSRFVEARRREWAEYRMQITNWELEQYLHKY